ncbi:MAG: helix-turn-helix transcriptional regulator [Candidatus Nanopelagicales bacterium]
MSHVVVIPTGSRTEPVATRVSTVVVCADSARTQLLQADSVTLGADVRSLSTAAQVREYADRHSAPEMCVIITPLPDGPVLPLMRMLRARGWHKIVVLSGHADARAVHAAALTGVRSVVVQPTTPATARPMPHRTGSLSLSERELEVLGMVADGQTNRVVGEKLGLSALTVKSHLARIARKLGSGDRAHMVATAIRNGYIR